MRVIAVMVNYRHRLYETSIGGKNAACTMSDQLPPEILPRQ